MPGGSELLGGGGEVKDNNVPAVADGGKKRKEYRYLSNWVPVLRKKKLYIEGDLLRLAEEPSLSNSRYSTCRILERVSGRRVASKNSLYALEGPFLIPDPAVCPMPLFVIEKFRNGFPEDWKIVADIWAGFSDQVLKNSASPPDLARFSLCSSEIGSKIVNICAMNSTTVPQYNKVPVTPTQGAVDFCPTGFKNPSCTVSRVQNSKLSGNGSAVIDDTIQVSQVEDISNNNTTVPILNENNAAASQVDDIDTSKVLKASTIHGREKKQPYVCATCSKHYFQKDNFLVHFVAHTRERLRNVKPKRQHKKKCVSFSLSDPVGLVGPSSIVKTINAKEGNLPENEKNHVDTMSDQENFPDGNNVEIVYDKTEMGTKDKLDTTINLSDDEDMSTPSISDEGDLISSPTLLATSDALSAAPTRTNRTNPSFGYKTSEVNHPESVPIYAMDDTINLSDDEEPTNLKEIKCTKKIMKKRHFTYQPLRQNQIPNGGFENETEDNPGPINHDLPKLNMARESGVKSRSSCGEALDKLKLVGPAISLIRTTSPGNTSRSEEKEAAPMRLKETENAVKSAKVCLPQKKATPPSMRETGDMVKRLKVCLPQTRATPSTEVTGTIRKRIKVCLPQSRPSPPSELITYFEDETKETCG